MTTTTLPPVTEDHHRRAFAKLRMVGWSRWLYLSPSLTMRWMHYAVSMSACAKISAVFNLAQRFCHTLPATFVRFCRCACRRVSHLR